MSTPERSISRATWLAERFLQVIPAADAQLAAEDGGEVGRSTEYLRRRRFIECVLLPGRVSAKLGGEEDAQARIELHCRVFTDAEWERTLSRWSEGSSALSHLLALEFPEEIDAMLETPLCPTPSEVTVSVGGQPLERWTREAIMITTRFCERLEEDPGALFLLRGKTREDVMTELWSRRRRGRTELREQTREQSGPAPAHAVEQVALDRFWSASPEVFKLHYTLRADELPASVLKRLDQLPVSLGNELVDRLFEEAYAQVAIRAQAYAIGL